MKFWNHLIDYGIAVINVFLNILISGAFSRSVVAGMVLASLISGLLLLIFLHIVNFILARIFNSPMFDKVIETSEVDFGGDHKAQSVDGKFLEKSILAVGVPILFLVAIVIWGLSWMVTHHGLAKTMISLILDILILYRINKRSGAW